MTFHKPKCGLQAGQRLRGIWQSPFGLSSAAAVWALHPCCCCCCSDRSLAPYWSLARLGHQLHHISASSSSSPFRETYADWAMQYPADVSKEWDLVVMKNETCVWFPIHPHLLCLAVKCFLPGPSPSTCTTVYQSKSSLSTGELISILTINWDVYLVRDLLFKASRLSHSENAKRRRNCWWWDISQKLGQ